MKIRIVAAGLCLLMAACAQKSVHTNPASEPLHVVGPSDIEVGAYLVEIGGCHDCHTPGWAQMGRNVPEDQLLVGGPVGFSGRWGTSYPANLRLALEGTGAGEWAEAVKDRNGLPPMPWATLHAMSRQDLMAIHAYISSLGPAGAPAPMAVTDGSAPRTPYIWFEPVGPESWPTPE